MKGRAPGEDGIIPNTQTGTPMGQSEAVIGDFGDAGEERRYWGLDRGD